MSASPTASNLYVPSDAHLGGERVSTSYLSTWGRCPLEWFLTYLCPHPAHADSAGLRPAGAKATPLNEGTVWHDGLYHYRLTGWRNGGDSHEYDIDGAIATMLTNANKGRHLWESPEDFEAKMANLTHLLEKYHHLGMAKHTSVVADGNGDPVLEREYQIPLTDPRLSRSYLYTVKVDAILESERGDHQIGEYKALSYRGLSAEQKGIHLTLQTQAELAVLHSAFPTAPLNGIRYEFAIKDRGQRSTDPTFIPWPVTIEVEVLDLWREYVVQWLAQIELCMARWHLLQNKGYDPWRAGLLAFPGTGRANKQCVRYYRLCDFAAYCERPDLAANLTLGGFLPKTVAGEEYTPTPEEEMPEVYDL